MSLDIREFSKYWLAACDNQVGKLPEGDALEASLRLAASVLDDYQMEEISSALIAHLRKSRYIPTPADIIQIIEGEIPPDSVLVELAAMPNTILGFIVSRDICATDFNHNRSRDLMPRAAANRNKYEEFHRRALIGEYTDSEIRMFNIKQVNLFGEIAPGVPGCRKPFRDALLVRVNEIGVPISITDQTDSANDIASPEVAEKHMDHVRKVLNQNGIYEQKPQ